MEKELIELLQAQNFDEAADYVKKYTPEALAETINELTNLD